MHSVIEVENRVVLKRFNDVVLSKVGVQTFDHVMLIDGNDDRGIDVGIMTKKDYKIVRILSHVDDTDIKGEVFSRGMRNTKSELGKAIHFCC